MPHQFLDFPTEEVVEIDWVDSYGGGNWLAREEVLKQDRKPAFNRTVGYVLRRDAQFVDIAQSRSGNDNTDNRMHIPRSAIAGIRVLQKKRK